MEEIRAGEYVRWKGGSIRKVTRLLTSDETYIEIDGLGDIATYKWEMLKNMITKHSPNIFDLVEVGDYVNGFEVENVTDEHIEFYCNMRLTREQFNDWVKSIVTREAMKSVEYTIE